MISEYTKTYNEFLSLSNLCKKEFSDSKSELNKSMKRTGQFLEALGSPHKKLKIIHIAGTSGKGSTCFILHQILTANKQNVGTYLSPHTTTFLERFQFNEKLLSANELTSSMKKLIKTYETFLEKYNTPLSFFELATCLSLFAFHQANAKWCVLETGCGGRWDATNVIPTPEIAAITNIDKDHTDLLGNTLEKIAFEKAGIIKKNGIVFCGETRPKLKKIFQAEADKKSATLFFITPPKKNIIHSKHGAHQQKNALLAMTIAEKLKISDETIKSTLNNIKRLPCRFETIQSSPRIILDGAHSPAKISAVAEKIKDLKKPIHLIFGCAANKDIDEMLKKLIPLAKKITTTRFQMGMRKSAIPSDLLKNIPKTKRSGSFLNHADALIHAKNKLKKDEIIIITGSLFLAGEMRTNWISEKEIIKSSDSFKK